MRLIWLALFGSLLAAGCSSPRGERFELVERYQLTNVNQADYAEYQRDVRERLKENWQALLASDVDLPRAIVPGVRNFTVNRLVSLHSPTDHVRDALCRFSDAKPRGMLLIHGLYDSPYIMRDLENYFRSRCFVTRSILLPGHGTRPGSLLKIKFEDWVDTVDFAITALAGEVDDNVFIAGFSTGGALALNSVFENRKIKGLFLFAPALKVESGAAYAAKKSGLEWIPFHRLEDSDVIKYESMTLDSVIAVDRLANRVRAELESGGRQLSIPVFVVVAENDYTIKSETAIELFREGRFGEKAEMIIYTPEKPRDTDRDPYSPTYLNSRFVHRQNGRDFLIADYSHMALTLKPDDAHYGLEGDYRYCLQYIFDSKRKKRCEDATLVYPDVCFGERSLLGSKNYVECSKRDAVVRRLTSNPRFDDLTKRLGVFIDRHVGK